MRYKHIESGAIIDSSSKIIGDAWVSLDEVKQKEPETTEEYVEEEIDLEEMTNKELEEFAKKEGIELTSEDKKNKETRIDAIVKAIE